MAFIENIVDFFVADIFSIVIRVTEYTEALERERASPYLK